MRGLQLHLVTVLHLKTCINTWTEIIRIHAYQSRNSNTTSPMFYQMFTLTPKWFFAINSLINISVVSMPSFLFYRSVSRSYAPQSNFSATMLDGGEFLSFCHVCVYPLVWWGEKETWKQQEQKLHCTTIS